jgi:hypothetical protein
MDDDFEKRISARADELLKDPDKVNSIVGKLSEEELDYLVPKLLGSLKGSNIAGLVQNQETQKILDLTELLKEELKKRKKKDAS